MASIHAMPFLVMNLGAEMIFILEQRLQAQSVTKDKSTRVLQDVLGAMFASSFMEELMRPQHLYSTAGIREIFDNLAHASIMRLSENSMEKLYELMLTGTKQAFVTVRHPFDLIEVTLNHLDSLVALVGTDFAPLTTAHAQFIAAAKRLSVGDLANVQKTLLTFFSAKKIKVTLFLQEKLQNSDGSFNIEMGGPVYQHTAVEAPGAVRYFAADGLTVAATTTFAVPSPAGGLQPQWTANPNGNATSCNPFIASQRTTTLGRNIFLTERKKDGAAPNGLPTPQGSAPAPSPGGTGASIVANAVSDPKMMRTKDVSADSLENTKFQGSFAVGGPNAVNTTTAGLNSLAGIAGASSRLNAAISNSSAGGAGNFKLSNLFGEDDAGADEDTISLPPAQQVVRITAAADGTNAELKGLMGGFDDAAAAGARKKPKTEEEELLDLIS